MQSVFFTFREMFIHWHGFSNYFGKDFNEQETIVSLTVSTDKHPVFSKNTFVKAIEFGGNIYVTANTSKYTWEMFLELEVSLEGGSNLADAKKDIVDIYNIYSYFQRN